MAKVSIEAKQGVYLSYRNYTYTAAQVFGEYIDNAIQSTEDHKSQLLSITPSHKLRVDINIDWVLDDIDNVVKANKIVIRDNAAGMTSDIFAHAFNLADGSITRKGMNEFGIGMKAASAWLGNNWEIESTSIEDNVTRVLKVDLTKVSTEQIKELDSEEFLDETRIHGTTITITNLWPENVIKRDDLKDLIKTVASIYRFFIRHDEIKIYFADELLSFEEYEVLVTPPYTDPDGEAILWKQAVSHDDHQGHTISGFIGLLKDMSEEHRGVVFTRNNRVVLGFDSKDRTVGKVFMGQAGSKKYRRVFGELEIGGFDVAFGKNRLNNLALLESLCKCIAGKLKINGVNLLTEADKYKANSTKKAQISKKTKTDEQPVPQVTQVKDSSTIYTVPSSDISPTSPTNNPHPDNQQSSDSKSVVSNESVLSMDTFVFKDATYKIKIVDSNESSDILWNDLSNISNMELICKLNIHHPFFQHYGSPNEAMLAIFKALSISKFKTMNASGGNASEMMNTFNSLINSL